MTSIERRGESRFYAAADGLRLHVRDYDPGETSGAPLVCLAGLTRNSDDFEPLARALAFGQFVRRRVIAFDYRGRGLSDHDADWHHYDIATEQADVLAGLAFCGVTIAHWLGTSRGGLHIMALAGTRRPLMRSAILNDIGPVLEPAGLLRIKGYVGKPTHPPDLEAAIRSLKLGAGLHFTGLSDEDWRHFTITTFGGDEARLGLRYDPALARGLDSFEADTPLPTLWPQFDELRDMPLLTLRGDNSDLLSPETFAAMSARWPSSEALTIPGQGHAPLLSDQATIGSISEFLERADQGA